MNNSEPSNGMKVFLRAELLQLKLDLLEKLAHQDVVEQLSKRVTTIEQHGSPKLIDIKDQVNEVDKRMTIAEARNPEQVIKEFRDTQNDIKSLFAWRNRIIGATMLISSPVVYLIIRLWTGH